MRRDAVSILLQLLGEMEMPLAQNNTLIQGESLAFTVMEYSSHTYVKTFDFLNLYIGMKDTFSVFKEPSDKLSNHTHTTS